jgi:glucose-1-phosphate adenylyltransferase
MKNTLALVLGGGRGTRLYPLTKYRSKPAVPLGGKYRLIDIPLSNCINAGLNRIYVLTQFNSVSLHRHIRRTYNFDAFSNGFVELLAAQQTNDNMNWYQGTADAVRQNLRYIEQADADYVLILSGDQLYRMDFQDMLRTHRETKADVTIAGLPVNRETAKSMGIMRLNDDGRVAGFLEKPKTSAEIDIVKMDPAWIDAHGIPSKGRDCMASMGIYLFNKSVLVDVLTKTNYQDFGKEIFPAAIHARRVQVHLFDGYWEDIGTIRSFYEANLLLASPNRPFDLNNPDAPIYTASRYLPPNRFDGANIKNSLISDGCIIEDGARIENSVVGLRCRIGKNVNIKNSILMGADMYDDGQSIPGAGPSLGIGEGTYIDHAIIDKNCRIGRNCRIANDKGLETSPETDAGMIADGIVMINKGAVLLDGWNLA